MDVKGQRATTKNTCKSILIIDDNECLMNVIGKYLEKHGMKVDFASDGEKGLQKLFQQMERHDLVLLDIQMPGMDGFDVLRSIRMDSRSCVNAMPVIAMSGGINREGADGFDCFLEKPFSFESLIPAIMQVFEEEDA